jgi:hypothetical protein
VPIDEKYRFIPRGDFIRSHKVKLETLDDILEDSLPVDVLHMDIEGSEADALLGAQKTLARSTSIKIVCEWFGDRLTNAKTKQKYEQCRDLLRDFGFHCYRIETEAYDGLDGKIRLKQFSFDNLDSTGMCDLLFVKSIDFDHILIN